MGEVLSKDVLDWARDLAAINKLLAGEQIEQSQPCGSAKILNFSARSVGFSLPQHRNSPIIGMDRAWRNASIIND